MENQKFKKYGVIILLIIVFGLLLAAQIYRYEDCRSKGYSAFECNYMIKHGYFID